VAGRAQDHRGVESKSRLGLDLRDLRLLAITVGVALFESLPDLRHERDPLRAPGRSVKWIGEILGLVRYFPILELHDAHGKRALVSVVDLILSNPELALSYYPANDEIRRLSRMMTAQRLQICATMNDLA
jgi:hypothetical protein